MDRPKIPDREFKDRERDLRQFLNGIAQTVTNILDYLEEDKKVTDRLFKNKKDSELTVAEVRERRREQEQSLEDIRKDLNSLREKVNESIINDEQNQEQ